MDNEERYRELLELEMHLDDLAETPGWAALENTANERLNDLKRRLYGGELTSHDEYLKVSWQIRGAEWVLTGILEETRQLITEYRRQEAELTVDSQ